MIRQESSYIWTGEQIVEETNETVDMEKSFVMNEKGGDDNNLMITRDNQEILNYDTNTRFGELAVKVS